MMDPSPSSSSAATPDINLATNGSTIGDSADLSIPILSTYTTLISRRYQHFLDKSNPHVLRRWTGLSIVALIYIIRVAIIQGFYLVSYALGIYILNLLIAFLSPQVDPETVDNGDGPTLPTRSTDEYRPFVRRLPEFKFWYSITKAFCIAFVLTFFEVFDIPVFWPILVFYWFILFVATMKRQLLHMVKHKYVPFSTGKQVPSSAMGKGQHQAMI